MRIKRVEAGSVAEAMRELRRDLGDHALILHTKHLPPKGLTGWFKTPRVEILGAIDEPELMGAPSAAPTAPRTTPPAVLATAVPPPIATPEPAPAPQTIKPKRGRKSSKTGATPVPAAPQRQLVAETADSVLAGIGFSAPEWTPAGRRARRIALVGPTGAGKTTTLAKLAAKAHLEHGRRVGLVTIDTYRIGAVPQLAAYADILGAPLEVAATPDELNQALGRLAECDVIFIDTIGRSALGGGVDGLVPFLAVAAADEVHLVLSATTRAQDSIRAAGSFARLAPNRLVITKIDETDDYSAVGAVCRTTGLPLSWLGTGQEVPDDLESATPARLATLLAASCAA
jgi:flagellar biosynthesis protein FlhF